ncbi:MAG: nitronate monooxygenase [Pseudomonadales bacterium]|jgi:NAD(P)H-dependent flavin oxidoreductase YrpB (nitropropane dioxygenase family)|nr:nitronate monooxygenase [Pseudomonadales bacterium]MDP6829004.1 nitronate monooxygenase [Pseudomonadales bacterium]|tara:strand:- start:1887 stop:3041 length:1155 start_codon:yes stop_codon:yes gene_type:complete
MKSRVCDLFDIEFPLFAFSHCRDIVVEVSKAGGFGVLGAVGHTPESLEIELGWIDAHIDGNPYGVDLLVPNSLADTEDILTLEEIQARIPLEHKQHVEKLLVENGIDAEGLWDFELADYYGDSLREGAAGRVMDAAFRHPIKLIVNALGVPPLYMMEKADKHGIPVGALTGSKEHALKHAEAGVDLLIVSGTEAGGHCGEISTLVLVPEVLSALGDAGFDLPVLAAGGIVTGRQMAACMTMGAEGAWTGSVWLTTVESEVTTAIREKMVAAGSSQTVRSRSRSGKYTRQLRSGWTDAWLRSDAPAPLPMPLQGLVTERALEKIDKLSEGGHARAKELATYLVGQGVGLMNTTTSARQVVYDFKEDFIVAMERAGDIMSDADQDS